MKFGDAVSRLILERATPILLSDPRVVIGPDFDFLPRTEEEVLGSMFAGKGLDLLGRGGGKWYVGRR